MRKRFYTKAVAMLLIFSMLIGMLPSFAESPAYGNPNAFPVNLLEELPMEVDVPIEEITEAITEVPSDASEPEATTETASEPATDIPMETTEALEEASESGEYQNDPTPAICDPLDANEPFEISPMTIDPHMNQYGPGVWGGYSDGYGWHFTLDANEKRADEFGRMRWQAVERIDLSTQQFTLGAMMWTFAFEYDPQIKCTLNLPPGMTIVGGDPVRYCTFDSTDGDGCNYRNTWSIQMLPDAPSGQYTVTVNVESRQWSGRFFYDTFSYSIPVNYTGGVAPPEKTVYEIRDDNRNYYLVGFDNQAVSVDSVSLNLANASMVNDNISNARVTLNATGSTTGNPFAVVSEIGGSSGKVYNFVAGNSKPWVDTRKTIDIPSDSTTSLRVTSTAGTQPAHQFPLYYQKKTLFLDTFREEVLEQVRAALNNNGISIPASEEANLRAGVFHGVDRYGFGELIINTQKLDISANEKSVYYLYARHMAGLSLTSWMAEKVYGGSGAGYQNLKTKGLLKKCGFMTPEAILGLKDGREFTAEEFFIVGQIGRDLGMDYIGMLQLASSMTKLQSDYAKLKKLSGEWVYAPVPSGVWIKISMPKDPTRFPASGSGSIKDVYINIDDNNNGLAVIADPGASTGRVYHCSSGNWSMSHYASIPVSTAAAVVASSPGEADALRSSMITNPVGTTRIIQFDFVKYANEIKRFMAANSSIDYTKLNAAEKKSFCLAIAQSADDNLCLGLYIRYVLGLNLDIEDSDVVYYQTKHYTDCVFLTHFVVTLEASYAAAVAFLQTWIPTFMATVGSSGAASPALAVDSVGVVASGLAVTYCAARVGISTYHCTKSQEKMLEALELKNKERFGYTEEEFKYIEKAMKKGLIDPSKWTGKLKGAINEITDAEWLLVDEWLQEGKNVNALPTAKTERADFYVESLGIVELKTVNKLGNPDNLKNQIERAFKSQIVSTKSAYPEYASAEEFVFVDARQADGFTKTYAENLINRIMGKYSIPGKVVFYLEDGTTFIAP